MEHLFAAWPRVSETLRRSAILLLSDFDGTLTPIVSRPSGATLSEETRSVLKQLNDEEWCTVALISGRPLRDLVGRVNIEGIIYVGNHGSEIEGPGLFFQAPLPEESVSAIRRVVREIGALPLEFRGVEVEDKELSLSVHFRNAAPADIGKIAARVSATVAPFVDFNFLRVDAGKKVFEVRPSSWDKGKAVDYVMESLRPRIGGFLPIFLGDDTTDEDAFRAVGDEGLTVFVGDDGVQSCASYRLSDTDEVLAFLKMLLSTRDNDEDDKVKYGTIR